MQRNPVGLTSRLDLFVLVAGLLLAAAPARAALINQLSLAADTLALSDGAAVSTWNDTSGFGRNATQVTVTLQPTFKTAVLNGLPVVRFTGAGSAGDIDALKVDFTSDISQPLSFFVVANIKGNATAPNATDYVFDAGDNSTPNSERVILGLNLNATGDSHLGIWAGSAVEGNDRSDWDSGWRIYEVYFNDASSVLYTDGAALLTGNPGNAGILATRDLRIGSRIGDILGLNGDIAEFQLYSGTPTFDERQAIGFALAKKYKLSGAYGYIPEPASALLLLASGGLLALRRRARR